MLGFSCILSFSILLSHSIMYIMGNFIPCFCYNSHFAFVSQQVSECLSHVPFSFIIQHTLIQLLSNHFNSYSHWGSPPIFVLTPGSAYPFPLFPDMTSVATDIILTISIKFFHFLPNTLFSGFPVNSVAIPPKMSMVCNAIDII